MLLGFFDGVAYHIAGLPSLSHHEGVALGFIKALAELDHSGIPNVVFLLGAQDEPHKPDQGARAAPLLRYCRTPNSSEPIVSCLPSTGSRR